MSKSNSAKTNHYIFKPTLGANKTGKGCEIFFGEKGISFYFTRETSPARRASRTVVKTYSFEFFKNSDPEICKILVNSLKSMVILELNLSIEDQARFLELCERLDRYLLKV